MSGIAGIVRFDDRSVRRQVLERVANALHQYGPDKDGVIAQDNVGLVHVLMRMTPEDRYDHQPTRGAGGTMITADLRIDNRDDLLGCFSLNRQLVAEWSDARLLLFGWETAFFRCCVDLSRLPYGTAAKDH
jgi:asparagine synthase (glutamine-hydrolysing)